MSSINDVVDSVLVEVSDVYKFDLNDKESIVIRVKKFNIEYFSSIFKEIKSKIWL